MYASLLNHLSTHIYLSFLVYANGASSFAKTVLSSTNEHPDYFSYDGSMQSPEQYDDNLSPFNRRNQCLSEDESE